VTIRRIIKKQIFCVTLASFDAKNLREKLYDKVQPLIQNHIIVRGNSNCSAQDSAVVQSSEPKQVLVGITLATQHVNERVGKLMLGWMLGITVQRTYMFPLIFPHKMTRLRVFFRPEGPVA
jgi:hypothetical protein